MGSGKKVNQAEIIKYCDNYLDITKYHDYCPNGLQVEGDSRIVRKIGLGVSISLEFIQLAIESKCDLIITHHGLLWDKDSRIIQGPFKQKVQHLLHSGIAAAAYHLPLDDHPIVGNNVQIAELLSLKEIVPLPDQNENNLGVIGKVKPTGIDQFSALIENKLERKPLVLDFGRDQIRSVAIVTGGAQDYLLSAVEAGADCFITGEVSERNFAMSKENQIHFISAGHYQTEKFGIQALGRHLAEEFDVTCEFIDIPNPI